MPKQIVIIGGGPAGIEAAKAARAQGAEVTLVSNAPVGGRAGWHSLLPSKVWLSTADAAGVLHETPELGAPSLAAPSAAAVLERLRAVRQRWNEQQQQQLVEMGVKIVTGTAVFHSADTLDISDKDGAVTQQLCGDAFIVTSGSVPIFPPTMKPNGKQIIAPRFASGLDPLPPSIVVVGGGATGSEFAYLFNRLGVQVTWVVDELGVLPEMDRDAANFLAQTLQEQGVTLAAGHRAARIEETAVGVRVVTVDGASHEAAMAFLAIGRKPDVSGLNLDAAGLTVANGTTAVDAYGRSTQPHIYLAGDVTGAPMIANRAMAQARVAGLHAAGAATAPFAPELVIAAVYTDPQVAQVGTMHGETVQLPLSAGLKGMLSPAGGFVKLVYDGENGRLRGAVAAGAHAADIVAPVAVALHAGMTVSDFAGLYGAHPTLSELAFAAARAAV